jgi:ABC-type nitrate/sulfonate/bicarbonate transport system substrate-binding protein
MLPTFDPKQPYVCVMGIDESLGADGIVADRDIRSITDLKGKLVAFNQRTVSQFFLHVLLREAGLSEADIETVNLSHEGRTRPLAGLAAPAAVQPAGAPRHHAHTSKERLLAVLAV